MKMRKELPNIQQNYLIKIGIDAQSKETRCKVGKPIIKEN